MTLKTELPTNLLLPLPTIQQQIQNILPTRIYRQLKYTANDNKLPTIVSVSEENFSLAEKIKSVPVHFKDKMYQYILSQNQRPPTGRRQGSSMLLLIFMVRQGKSRWIAAPMHKGNALVVEGGLAAIAEGRERRWYRGMIEWVRRGARMQNFSIPPRAVAKNDGVKVGGGGEIIVGGSGDGTS